MLRSERSREFWLCHLFVIDCEKFQFGNVAFGGFRGGIFIADSGLYD